MIIGVDVGGTFTDAILIDGEHVYSGKSPSTPIDQSLGVLAAIRTVLAQAAAGTDQVESFAHGLDRVQADERRGKHATQQQLPVRRGGQGR